MAQQVLTSMERADYVALIRVKHIDVIPQEWNPETQRSGNLTDEVTNLLVAEFEAVRVFKGPETAAFAVTLAAEVDCGVAFEPAEAYLVYANQPEDLTQVTTSRCMRTALESESARDIEILEDAADRKRASRARRGSPRFVRALGLIHAYEGCGEYRWRDPKFQADVTEALAIADELGRSEPGSGGSQALRAELMSIWQLKDGGEPVQTRKEILALTEEALQFNPALAQAHVARARVHAKSDDTLTAVREMHKALSIDPLLEGAALAQAEIYRLNGDVARAERWAHAFIDAARDPVQRANGYEWLGRMRQDIAHQRQAISRDADLALAKAAFERSVREDPSDPWRLTNVATFLNEHAADFAAAERYARDALALEDLLPARYQLAAARYQALQSKAAGMDSQRLRAAIDDIAAATGLTLDELASSREFRDVVRVRLIRLQRSARPAA